MTINWHNLGYAKFIGQVTGSQARIDYPTRDCHSAKDEADFIAGYEAAKKDYQISGFNPIANYADEKFARNFAEKI